MTILQYVQVLRKIEELKTRNLHGEKYSSQLDKTLNECFPMNTDEREATKRADVASHFILRAAYCRTEDLRRWFLTQECALFKHEISKLKGSQLVDSLSRYHIVIDQVSRVDKERLREKLLSIPTEKNEIMSIDQFTKEIFFKVPFTEALDLVMNRKCYIAGGYAFVPADRLMVILLARYRVMLSKSLTQAALAFTHITGVEESSRIAPLLYTMNSQYTGKSYHTSDRSSGPSSFDGSNVDDYVQNMPLCMSQLHKGLKSDHKLKHWGRLQYGLFLKGAGLSMEESMVFFQREFTKLISPEKFQKEYAYNIRHMYGKEGKRTDYTPYNCMKIVMGNPPQGTGDHHGCPFKHYDDEHLSALLNKLHIGQGDLETILNHKRMKNYSLACVKHFEVTHPNYSALKDIPLGGVGDHPNAWFAASVAYREAKAKGKDIGVSDDKMVSTNSNNMAEQYELDLFEDLNPMDVIEMVP